MTSRLGAARKSIRARAILFADKTASSRARSVCTERIHIFRWTQRARRAPRRTDSRLLGFAPFARVRKC